MPTVGKLSSSSDYGSESFKTQIIQNNAGLCPREIGLELEEYIMAASLALLESLVVLQRQTHLPSEVLGSRWTFIHGEQVGFARIAWINLESNVRSNKITIQPSDMIDGCIDSACDVVCGICIEHCCRPAVHARTDTADCGFMCNQSFRCGFQQDLRTEPILPESVLLAI